MAHTCNSALKRLRQEDHELEKSLGYIARPYLTKEKKKIPSIQNHQFIKLKENN